MKERIKLLLVTVVFFISLLMVFACSDDGSSTKPTSETFTQTISANEGTVVTYDGMLLNFEAGTVSESFEIEINKLEDVENIGFANYELIGDVYEVIHDDEVMFNNSVSISFDYESDNEIDPNNVFIGRYLNGEWSKLQTSYNEATEMVSAMTDQLCWFAKFWGEGPDITEIIITPPTYSNVSLSSDSFTDDLVVNLGYTDHNDEVISAHISLSLLGGTIPNAQDLGTLLSGIAGDYDIIYLPFVPNNMSNSIVLEMEKVNFNYQYIMDKADLATLYQNVDGFDAIIFNVELLDSSNNILDTREARVDFYTYAFVAIDTFSPIDSAIPSPDVVWGFIDSPDLDPADYTQEKYWLVIDESNDPFSASDKEYEAIVNFSDITDSIDNITHHVEAELEIGETYFYQVKVSKDGSFTGERVIESPIRSFTVIEEVIEDTESPSFGDTFIPAPNSIISGDVILDVYVTDNVRVSQVDFGISGASIYPEELGVDGIADANNHFTFVFDSYEYEDGHYDIEATAYDTNDNHTTVAWPIIIDNTNAGTDYIANLFFSPTPGYYSDTQIVSIGCSTPNVEIRYTFDGSQPNQDTAMVYDSPLIISESTTIKAKAFKIGLEPSNILAGYYNIDENASESIFVPGGTFTMGDTSQGNHEEELPTHQVTLSPFYINKYEQTYSKFIEFLNAEGVTPLGYYHSTQIIDLEGSFCAIYYQDGSFHFEANEIVPSIECPVSEVNWLGAIYFSNWLSLQEGLIPCYETNTFTCDMTANGYRLPTEAEWEYAARGASNNPDYLYAGSSNIDDVAWCDYNNDPYGTKEVGTKAPNGLGIYDMSGNVYEWCFDSYGPYTNESVTNPTGADSGFIYVVRGGGWSDTAEQCRVSHRGHQGPYVNHGNVGFRLVHNAE